MMCAIEDGATFDKPPQDAHYSSCTHRRCRHPCSWWPPSICCVPNRRVPPGAYDEAGLIMSAGCNGIAVACYAAAGFTFGVTIVGGPPAIAACNVALGTCMATCATVALLAPTP
ncbi:hypothetical protein HWV62_41102 [Athelia sp. TMB]|nr:hypothetical protein HWV62_41102 [Athelia sp. TMB]